MASSSSTSTAATTADFPSTCDGFAVDSRLLYNDIEHLSNKRFRRNRQLVTWTRLLACAAVVSAGIGGVAAYYQRAKIYRVWRLRNPHRVRQLSIAMMISGGFSFCTLLFLISPIGFMRMHDMETKRTHQLDAVAVAALVQEQNFRTLAAWGTTAKREEGGGVSALHRPSSSLSVVPQEEAAAAAAAQQWVWKEVVLDAALLPGACTPTTVSASSDAEAAESAEHAGSGNAQEERAVQGGEDVAALKREMAAQLLLPSSTKTTPTTKSASTVARAEAKSEEDDISTSGSLHAPRRVIAYTNDAAALQSALVATAEMWEALVKAKADIVAKVI